MKLGTAYDPKSEKFQSRRDIRSLTDKNKNFYPLFNMFELEMSRLMKISSFIQLVSQLSMFNQQLLEWKANKHDIKNIVMTYALYQNLFSRLRYVINMSRTYQQSVKAVNQSLHWFYIEKPTIRCEVEEIKPQINEATSNKNENIAIEDLAQKTALKREMQVYQSMSRTVHNEFFPPKQQLKQYKRKNLLPLQVEQQKLSPNRKTSSISVLSKIQHEKLRSTMSTMMGTKSSFKQTSTPTKSAFRTLIQSDFKNYDAELDANMELADRLADQRQRQEQQFLEKQQRQNIQKKAEIELEVIEREKKVAHEDIMQQKLILDLGEEDEPDAIELGIDDEDQPKFKKIYSKEKNEQQLNNMYESMKETQQSTLRRMLKISQDQMRSKMEDLNIKRNAISWSKVKGKFYNQKQKNAQVLSHLNKYKRMSFEPLGKQQIVKKHLKDDPKFLKTTGFKEVKQKNKPIEVKMFHRTQSLHPGSLQGQLQKKKLNEAIEMYKKYTDHLNRQSAENDRQDSTMAQLRATSLTSINRVTKKDHFSNILHKNRAESYNDNMQGEIYQIKSSLSGKSLPIQNASLYNGLSIIPPQEVDIVGHMFGTGKTLPSNPFFPKSFGGGGGKKKKKKRK